MSESRRVPITSITIEQVFRKDGQYIKTNVYTYRMTDVLDHIHTHPWATPSSVARLQRILDQEKRDLWNRDASHFSGFFSDYSVLNYHHVYAEELQEAYS